MPGAREEVENEKPRFRKCGFFVVFYTGLYSTHAGGKGGGRKRKNHVLESVVFSWFAIRASIVPKPGAREEVENEKPRFRKCGFSWFAIRASIVPMPGAREEVENEKTTF